MDTVSSVIAPKILMTIFWGCVLFSDLSLFIWFDLSPSFSPFIPLPTSLSFGSLYHIGRFPEVLGKSLSILVKETVDRDLIVSGAGCATWGLPCRGMCVCGQVGIHTSLFLKFILILLKNCYWSITDSQCCVSFRCTTKWISYTYTYIHSSLESFLI